MRRTWCATLVALSLVVTAGADPPKLAVIIVVDQMRADYVDRFQGDWSAGLKRLVAKGAWFSRAAYPYLETFTCVGHATIGTGAFPGAHGIFQNAWFDRGQNALVTCTQDPGVKAVSYGTEVPGSESASRLRIPTFAEEMHRQRGSRVVSLSLKARSAIMLAGHSGDAVVWLSETFGGWATSTAFSPAPVPEVAAFVSANRIEADYGKTWNLVLPPASYPEVDSGLGEAPPPGWTRSFPHVLKGNPTDSLPTVAYYQQWERSPYADAYLGRMAGALVASMQLGKHDTTDVLAVSFSSPDLAGHAFGPRSREVRDMYSQLDRTVGTLLDQLDRLVGPDQYVVALSADHGVAPIPEQLRAEGRDAGRIDATGIAEAIEQAARAALGPGRYVSRLVANDVYLEAGVFERLKQAPAAMTSVIKAAANRPGIERVFRSDVLASGSKSKDPLTRAAALSYVEDLSGDLILSTKSGWMFTDAGTTHGSASPDDQRVPIVLFGKGVKPGRYTGAATPADIAPTLADICGIVLAHAQGTVLHAARN